MKNNIYKVRLIVGFIIFLLSCCALLGIYPVKIFDYQFTALIQRVLFDFSVISLAGLILLIVITFIFGRFYCSLFCPFGFAQEIGSIIFKKFGYKPTTIKKNLYYKYIISAISFGFLIGGSSLIIRYIEPYSLFGMSISNTILGYITVFLILTLVLYKNRFFCSNICPVGAILGLISRFSINKIYIDKDSCINCGLCATNCPVGCIIKDDDKYRVDNEICIKCLKCISNCKRSAMKFFKEKKEEKEKIEFSQNRRKIIFGIPALAVLAAAYASGIKFSKAIAQKVKNIILPPGSEDANRMETKCLHCNLCVRHCPNGILTIGDNGFSAVQVDYTKGKGFCQHDCNKCSELCPSGAIKKISLREKQHTKIAVAKITDKCVGCGHCVNACPVGAISVKRGEIAKINENKCIGCGKCKKSCPIDAIEIYGISKQSRA